MLRDPDYCPYRKTVHIEQVQVAVCDVLSSVTGVADPAECQVHRDVCEACCSDLREPSELNPVIASLAYTMASRIATTGGHRECSVEQSTAIIRRVTDHLSLVIEDLPAECFPPSNRKSELDSETNVRPVPKRLQWATAMLTAPRSEPRIDESLQSLLNAGFEHIHVFAEPGSWIPGESGSFTITQRGRKLGNFRNFYSCLSTLLHDHPDADAFAVFQDDIRAAAGLKEWCSAQLWPLDNGIVSLFTPRIHADRKSGWRILSPGFQRVCGAQALVFRRDMLWKFLSDARVLQCLRIRKYGDDAVLGGWLSREGRGIAYHTPSPVEHIGHISSLYESGPDQRNMSDAVSCVSQFKDWQALPAETGSIGLVGWNSLTGLGSLNRDLASHLGIERWFAPPHPKLESLPPYHAGRVQMVTALPDWNALVEWVRPLDWLLFAERPYVAELPRLAAHNGVGIACIPMWEWIQPNHEWLQFVDVMICPTILTYQQMRDWSVRYGFGWKCIYVPWPVDLNQFAFRQRNVCREFLFVNGWGGGDCRRLNGSPAPYRRKGLEVIIEAARIDPDLNFVIRSLEKLPANLPRNIRVAPAVADNSRLYNQGDVCVQPSHYEGLGLQLLECQAAGLPLITTDAAPMNEVIPWRLIPTCGRETVLVGDGYISASLIDPKDLVAILRPLVGQNIGEVSRQAHKNIASRHCWNMASDAIHAELIRR